jgi:hypothetical protein
MSQYDIRMMFDKTPYGFSSVPITVNDWTIWRASLGLLAARVHAKIKKYNVAISVSN